MSMQRLEITEIIDEQATLGTDQTDGQTKVGLRVKIAGQEENVVLILPPPVADELAHILNTGHRPHG